MNILIIGGGFGGVKTALQLAKNPDFHVTLVSDKDHFLYYPALYGMATGASHLESVVSLRKIFRGSGVKIVRDTIKSFDPTRRLVAGDSGKEYGYDTVVWALGVVTSYFGIAGLPEHSYSIKSADEVMRFKKHLHDELSRDHHMDKHYVVVGAGPTGVELAAALSSYLSYIAERHQVKHGRISVRLVEAAPRILPRMSEHASFVVAKRLRGLGVEILTDHKVEQQDGDSIMVNGRDVPTQTVVWTSGVSNHPFFAAHPQAFQLAPNGRVAVDDHMMAGDHTYVIGDNAATPYTGLAQTALHDALYVAADSEAEYMGAARPAYTPIKPPVVVPVGRNWAIFEWHGVILTGIVASWIRRIADLIGYDDMLPLGQALGVWRAERIHEESCSVCRRA